MKVEDGHPGFLSTGDIAAKGSETFYTNTPTEKSWITAQAVVPFEQAREAAHEFLRTGVIPRSVRWFEL